MAEALTRTRLTIAEYLALERSAPLERHEYCDGEVFAMSGGSLRHSLLAANAGAELRQALRGSSCLVLNSDIRVKIPGLRALHLRRCHGGLRCAGA